MTRLVSLAALAVLAIPALASAGKGEMLTPAQLLGRALAPKMATLAACGAPARAVARFALDFDGRAKNVRIEGVAAGSPVHGCLVRELSDLQMPVRLAFIVREIALPLPSTPVGGSASR